MNGECTYCKYYPDINHRYKCQVCMIEICHLCAHEKHNIEFKEVVEKQKEDYSKKFEKLELEIEKLLVVLDRINHILERFELELKHPKQTEDEIIQKYLERKWVLKLENHLMK